MQGRGEEQSGGQSRGGRERSDYELSGPSHTAGLTEHIMSEFKYTLHSCPVICPPPRCSTTNVPLHFCVVSRKWATAKDNQTKVFDSFLKSYFATPRRTWRRDGTVIRISQPSAQAIICGRGKKQACRTAAILPSKAD